MAIATPTKRPVVDRSRRIEKLHRYLDDAAAKGLAAPELTAGVWRACEALSRSIAGLPVPDACPAANGSLLLTWDRAEHHVELEFSPDEGPMFFYANRLTRAVWEAPFEADHPIPASVRQKLALVCDPA